MSNLTVILFSVVLVFGFIALALCLGYRRACKAAKERQELEKIVMDAEVLLPGYQNADLPTLLDARNYYAERFRASSDEIGRQALGDAVMLLDELIEQQKLKKGSR